MQTNFFGVFICRLPWWLHGGGRWSAVCVTCPRCGYCRWRKTHFTSLASTHLKVVRMTSESEVLALPYKSLENSQLSYQCLFLKTLSFSVSASMSLHPSSLYICLSLLCLCIAMSLRFSFSPSLCLPFFLLFVSTSLCLSPKYFYLSQCLSAYLSHCLSVYLCHSLCLIVFLSVFPNVFLPDTIAVS